MIGKMAAREAGVTLYRVKINIEISRGGDLFPLNNTVKDKPVNLQRFEGKNALIK